VLGSYGEWGKTIAAAQEIIAGELTRLPSRNLRLIVLFLNDASLPVESVNVRICAMRVVMLSKACIVGAYQRKLEELARLPGIELTVLVPPSWRDNRGEQKLERTYTEGYELREIPIAFNGRFHMHYYPRLGKQLQELQPDLLHIDEEPYNLATRHAMGLARKRSIPACFFTWQNLDRRYPPPFRWWEQYNYNHADFAIAGNHAATEVLRSKGYHGPTRVIPQFGVDPELFSPNAGPLPDRPFTIGYAGGFIAAKGVDTLLNACARLPGGWRLRLAGSGDQEQSLRALAVSLNIDRRLTWIGKILSTDMPDLYRSLDALVLPSRTQPNWMEQFGRVLVEAMACGVPVIGSNSGEIPHVIGDAGLVFPEGDAEVLAIRLRQLMDDPEFHADLSQLGRQRVLDRYTQAQIAEETSEVYQRMLLGTR